MMKRRRDTRVAPTIEALEEEAEDFRATRRALNEDLAALRSEIAAAATELSAFAQQLKAAPHG